MSLTSVQRIIKERTAAIYTANLVDEDGDAIQLLDLATLTLTLYDKDSGTIINSRDSQNVLNANNVTVSASGLLTWTMVAADNAIIGTISPGCLERHVALFEFSYGSSGVGKYEVLLDIQQMESVP